MKSFTAIIDKEEEMYVASCPEVGTVSQGESIEVALDNLREATELYLEEFPIKSKSRALMTTFEANA
jgi:predicted RNase H-like HicB family nuclease